MMNLWDLPQYQGPRQAPSKPAPKPHIKKAEGLPKVWEARGQRKIPNGSYLYACAHGVSPVEAYAAYIEMWRKHDAQAAKA